VICSIVRTQFAYLCIRMIISISINFTRNEPFLDKNSIGFLHVLLTAEVVRKVVTQYEFFDCEQKGKSV